MRKISMTATAILLAFGVNGAMGQALRGSDGPAEFPPASFTGKQYVDSKGCVFVRAGFDGAVNWVPRVSRSRKVLCGFSPSLASKPTPEPAPATVVATAPTPVTPRPAAPRPVATPPRQVAVAAPRVTVPAPTVILPAPRVTTPAPRVATPAPRVVAAAPRAVAPPVQAAPRVVTQQPVRTVTTSCPGVSALSQRYLSSTHRVRCGPQGTSPTSGVASVPAGPEITPPPGYRAAFEQDRFNPNRGLQTREGFAQMRLVWTAGVPRRLVDQNSGRDVTGLFPGLRFPFINLDHQRRYVAQNGWPIGSDEEGSRPSTGTTVADVASSARAISNVRVSTKNTPPAAVVKPAPAPAASNGHRYVQIGAFSNPINVDNSISRLRALGLPVRVGSYKKHGKTYKIVLAGPFGSPSQLNAGLAKVRRDGFTDAFTRK